jgi:hypothetical protein
MLSRFPILPGSPLPLPNWYSDVASRFDTWQLPFYDDIRIRSDFIFIKIPVMAFKYCAPDTKLQPVGLYELDR